MRIHQSQNTVFLVGCPRSGTTLLQSLLAAHSQIASFPESKFFQYLVPDAEDQPRRSRYGLVSRRLFPRLKRFFKDEMQRPELLHRLSHIPLRGIYTRQFITILHDLVKEQGKSILLEKTPEHLNYIDEIEKYVQGAKFIHLVRNGSETIASLYEVTHQHPEWWGGEWPLDWCIHRWVQAMEISKNHLNQPNHFLVHYKKLVESPQIVLEQICHFIGVEFEEYMLKYYYNTSKALIREASGRTVKSGIKNGSYNKFDRVFNDAQRQYIRQRISGVNLDF